MQAHSAGAVEYADCQSVKAPIPNGCTEYSISSSNGEASIPELLGICNNLFLSQSFELDSTTAVIRFIAIILMFTLTWSGRTC